MSKNNDAWQPTATRQMALARAGMLRQIRNFFAERQVLEVETPLLCSHSVTDPYIESFVVKTTDQQSRYLQSSPEYAMKRLLAAGYGSIYQICKAFRTEEAGRLHHPEFSILEWYQLDYTLEDLMQEMAELLQCLLPDIAIQRFSYQDLFLHYAKLDPFEAKIDRLLACLKTHGIHAPTALETDDALNLILSSIIEPQLPTGAVFVHHYPSSQAALAMLDPNPPHHALRFEVYVGGMELANGFQELRDAEQQCDRFIKNNQQRACMQKEQMSIDPYFLGALEHGLPACSGVALGLDRLLIYMSKKETIDKVISFNWQNT